MSFDTLAMPDAGALASTAGFFLLDENLARDVRHALERVLKGGVVFQEGSKPLPIFRHAVATAIGRINAHGRSSLFLRFLRDGPYEDGGEIPFGLHGKRLTHAETAQVITFIYSHMVNCFKGAITELLAAGPCLELLHQLKAENRLPREAKLYVGDTVLPAARNHTGFAKGADFHILVPGRTPQGDRSVVIAGVVEVKSYLQSPARLDRQLSQHLARAQDGLRLGAHEYLRSQIRVGCADLQAARISVLPSSWSLPRTFHFQKAGGRTFLHTEPGVPPNCTDLVERIGPTEWRITLRWSKEALEAAGYGMTFWFLEKVGEALYAKGVPKEWEGMTPAEAGQNAAKMMLYYAMLNCRTPREDQRAIALYNCYGFGYALGMNFRNPAGRRQMLWMKDLDEILAKGHNKDGCRIT